MREKGWEKEDFILKGPLPPFSQIPMFHNADGLCGRPGFRPGGPAAVNGGRGPPPHTGTLFFQSGVQTEDALNEAIRPDRSSAETGVI